MGIGKFIVIEGIDGSGKTTQIKKLKERFEKENYSNVYFTREPTEGETGKYVRHLLSGDVEASNSELATAFLGDRIYHNVNPINGIRKHIMEGTHVICDRYYYSNFAYQGFGEYTEWVYNMNLNCPDVTKPDLCIFIDVDPAKSIERINNRDNEDVEIYENINKLEEVRSKYMDIINTLSDNSLPNPNKFIIIDGNRSIDEIHEQIYSVIKDVFNSENEITEFYFYNDEGRIISIALSNGYVEWYCYDNDGHMIYKETSNGEITIWNYNDGVLVKYEEKHTGHSEIYTYENNLLVKVVCLDDNIETSITSYTYDDQSRVIKIEEQEILNDNISNYEYEYTEGESFNLHYSNEKTQTEYTAEYLSKDQLVSVKDEKGYVLESVYDQHGRCIRTVDRDKEKLYEYDTDGNCIWESDSNGNWKEFRYDINNKCIQIKFSNGENLIMEYDEDGRLKKRKYFSK